jgi:hypothetical protein
MPSRKNREFMENFDRCYNTVLQSSVKGIRAADIAKRLMMHRTTVHGYLNSLELMGKVYSEHGIWHAKTGEQGIKPSEKEIVIEFPIPKNLWSNIALLEIQRKEWEKMGQTDLAETMKTILEKLRETRIITIKGKNVDDLDLEKVHSLIQQAYEKGSKANLRGLFKRLKD